MELEEMKSLWDEMSARVEKLELVNEQNIIKMTQLKYKSKFSKLHSYELSGAVVCFAFGTAVLLNFHKLDTWYLASCGVLFVAFYYLLPILSLTSLQKLRSMDLSEGTYKETLNRFQKIKAQTMQYQRWGIVGGLAIMFVAIPIADKLLNGNDFFLNEIKPSVWGAMVFGVFFVVFAGRWGYGWYQRITSSAEDVLKNLEE